MKTVEEHVPVADQYYRLEEKKSTNAYRQDLGLRMARNVSRQVYVCISIMPNQCFENACGLQAQVRSSVQAFDRTIAFHYITALKEHVSHMSSHETENACKLPGKRPR
ncbi:hypothetical protein BTUL_0039g00450 [Botrytis tulipae]|uniref:Uncharacterized protein n=1 Tax=Botrytis tulipae TaxID=87230 RepID=A0A4Z1EWQ4_9HELO|nr:hypothetical protein BTUL_0039g00450 [Botrytis tulipae]